MAFPVGEESSQSVKPSPSCVAVAWQQNVTGVLLWLEYKNTEPVLQVGVTLPEAKRVDFVLLLGHNLFTTIFVFYFR